MGDSPNNLGPSIHSKDPTCIQDLPVEVQVLIHKLLPPSEYRNITEVCELWRRIVHTSIGLSVRIGAAVVAQPAHNHAFFGIALNEDGNPVVKSGYETVDAQIIAQIGIAAVKFDEVRNTILPPFLFPFLLRSLKFKRFISLKNFTRIMAQNLGKLKKLSLSQSTLKALELFPVTMNLPGLKKLRVTGSKQQLRYYHRSDAARYEAPLLVTNFMGLMGKDFPTLRSFKAQIPAVYHKDVKVMISILNFLARHKHTLKILSITYDEYHDLQQKYRSRPLRQGPQFDANAAQAAFNFEKMKNNSVLEKMCFSFNRHATQHMILLVNGIRDMIYSYTALRSLDFSHGLHTSPELSHWQLPPSLRYLKVDIKRGVAPPQQNDWELNLGILRRCTHLKKLQLDITTRRARLLNSSALPKSLEEIDIRKFKLDTADCTYILTELPNLRAMTFRNIGNSGDLGFNKQVLFDRVLGRQFQQVYIYRGIKPGPFVIDMGNPEVAALHGLFTVSATLLRIGWNAPSGAYRLVTVNLDVDMEMEEMDEMDMDMDDEDDEDDFDEDDLDVDDPNGPIIQLIGAAINPEMEF